MSKEGQIKAVIEEYLNLEEDLRNSSKEKEEALKRYNHLIGQPHLEPSYSIHAAAPIISAYEEIKDLDRETLEMQQKRRDLSEKIKDYVQALNGKPLHVRFEYDSLDHRAGDHTFFVENGELFSKHAPVSP